MERETSDRKKEELRSMALEWGADLFGVADLTLERDYIEEIYGEELSHLNRGVVAAVFFPAPVINQLKEGPTHTYLYYYQVINVRLDNIALTMANFLQKTGYEAFPVPASQRVTKDKFAGIFSHRLAASLAGLGWIGKSCSLINPEVGPRLRLVTVLTDAPLPADEPIENLCGNCRACIKACPAGALKEGSFELRAPLKERFDPGECDAYLSKVRVSFGKRVCGRCLAVCPYGSNPRKMQEVKNEN